MKLQFSLEDLTKAFTLLQESLHDKGSAGGTSTLAVFEFIEGDNTKLILRGYNSYIRLRTMLKGHIQREEGTVGIITIDYTQLLMILKTFTTYTNADGSDIQVELTVDEESGHVSVHIDYTYIVTVGGEDQEYENTIVKSYPSFDIISATELESLSIVDSGDEYELDAADMLKYIDLFTPLVNMTEMPNPSIGKLAFDEDWVFATTGFIIGKMDNTISHVLNGMSFTYAGLQVIKRACNEQLELGNTVLPIKIEPEKTMITLATEETQFTLFYFAKVDDMRNHFESYNKKHSFVISRSILDSALKRAAFEDDQVAVEFKNGRLVMTAGSFVQELPVYNKGVSEFLTVITIPIMQQALLGNDSKGLIEVYIDKRDDNRLYMILTGAENAWETILVLSNRVHAGI